MRYLRLIFFIPIAVCAFGLTLFIGMLLLDLVQWFTNFTGTFGGFLNNRNIGNSSSGIKLFINVAIAGYFASNFYFKVGNKIFPKFANTLYQKIGLYAMLIILTLILIVFSIAGFLHNDIIQPISLLVLVLHLILAFYTVLKEINY